MATAVVAAWWFWPHDAEAPAPPNTAPRASESAGARPPFAADHTDHCGHPWLPPPGARLRYRWRQPSLAEPLVLDLERSGETRRSDGSSIRWDYHLHRPGERARRATARTVCGESGAEEPWLGIGYRVLGTHSVDVGALLPRALDVGATFDGSAGFTSGGDPLVIRRHAAVVDQDEIVTPAGAFQTRRLEILDDVSFADRANQREVTQWITRGLGLVRYEESVSGTRVLELELVDVLH